MSGIDDDPCQTCFYNRPINAWGETVMACWYSVENHGKELYVDNGGCSGFDPAEKQMEMELIPCQV